MSEPPYPSGSTGRPQDTPRFPTYGRPDDPAGEEPSYPRQESPSYPPPAGDAPFAPPGPSYGGSSYPGSSYRATSYGGYPGGQQPNQPTPGYPAAYGTTPSPYGYGYGGYGYPGMLEAKTNSMATAALVTGLSGIIFGFVGPVAVGLGIAALVQIRRRQERGTAQAVVGLVLGTLQVIFFTALLVIGFATGWSTDDPDDDYSAPLPTYAPTRGSTDPGPTVNVDELAVGECFDDGEDEGEVIRMPCSELHDAELFADVTLPAAAYPGDRKQSRKAEAACDQQFRPYVGISSDESELEPGFWYPDQDMWEDGDRVVICVAYGPDGEQLDGSVKGSKR